MNGNLALNGDMDVKNICFYNIGTYRSIPCGGHDVHFYDTVTCKKSGGLLPQHHGGLHRLRRLYGRQADR